MTLIRDLIEIPDRVQKGDFVLHLAEDVACPERVLENYVVPPELVKCFDAALSLIRSAVAGRTSKAAYLHGSFGSGKSHFMAVLHLILEGNTDARAIPELAGVIAKHNEWLAGKKFLLVPYHMVNSHDMESGVLGGYVEFMRRTHAAAPIPPVYMSAAIIRQANDERASYGDGPFFKRLNAGAGGPWGDLDANWDPDSFDAAATAPPDSERHLRLVSALLATVASSQAEVISHRGGSFVRFDQGLSLISQHAAGQGYHAVILFLDELILWLAMNSADLGFIKREAAKLTNLVEAQSTERTIPLVSFVARQRDLRKLVGDHVPGAEKLSFGDSLDWQQGRFDTITLEDRNLPAIAEKRVLKCKSKTAKDELDAAFELTARMKDNVMNILLTQEGDRRMFRQVYPFSPALVQTLIAVSSVLQRERTALKVMMQLLVDQRDTLTIGEIIPVGDLFDVVAHGDEAFSQEMAIHFDNAKRLYHQKLLPLLEKRAGMRREELEQLPYADSRRTAFRNDDRLIKTLLLSALVPEVESLRSLTAERLAALNYGTIKTPIPGKEAGEVLRRLREWGSAVGEIRLGQETNPMISVQLSGVDTEGIIARASGEDNHGNRVRWVRETLFEKLGIATEGKPEQRKFERYYDWWWRNTRRSCTMLFKNIRELPESSFENAGEGWRLIIDFPFDETGHGPRDDLSMLGRFRDSHPAGAKTLAWVPSFFSADAMKDLGMLVILDHVLTGERFPQYSSHLTPQDRPAARAVLENQLSILRQRVLGHLEAAYGLDAFIPGSIDTVHELELAEHFVSLWPGFQPLPPVAATLEGAMLNLMGQALAHEFPAAPEFDAEVKSSTLKKVYELLLPATQSSDGRLSVEKGLRPLLRQIANPLLLGEMGVDATHFVLGQHWKNHFHRKAAETGSPMAVSNLRRWIDEPKPMGLPLEAQNLVMLLFAAQTDRTLFIHGDAEQGTLSRLPDAGELRTVKFPDAAAWDLAVKRAEMIFGLAPSPHLNAANLSSLAVQLKTKAAAARLACRTYAQRLRLRLVEQGLLPETSDRLKTAAATQLLLERLETAEGAAAIAALSSTTVATSEAAMGECFARASELEGNLDTANWEIFEAVAKLSDERQAAAREIIAEVAAALSADEHVVQLAPALKSAQAKAVRLLTVLPLAPPPPPPPPPPAPARLPKAEPRPGRRVVDSGDRRSLSPASARELLADVERKLKPGQSAQVDLSWVVEE